MFKEQKNKFLFITLLLCETVLCRGGYQVPEAEIEVYKRKGFKISIPHEEGVTLFAFHGNLNQEIGVRQAGKWSKEISRPSNGIWSIEDRTTRLQKGDVIFYWIFVQKNGFGYIKDNLAFVVDTLQDTDISQHESVRETAPDGFTVPKAQFKVNRRIGFEVSIPHHDGITLFAFHGNLNKEMEAREAGEWSQDITRAINDKWTFRDRSTELSDGDKIYYWTYIVYKDLGYCEDDGIYIVNKTKYWFFK